MTNHTDISKAGWAAWLVLVATLGVGCDDAPAESAHEGVPSVLEHSGDSAHGGEGGGEAPSGEKSEPAGASTTIRDGRRVGQLDIELETPAGRREAGVRCSTCHATMVDGPMKQKADELEEFHLKMNFDHGELSCGSCHAEQDRDRLRLADGTTIPFRRTMDLCGQCHGPQMRDYRNGAHGGMAGHWDRQAGGRERNNCVNCHDPHDPAYPIVQPAEGPKDRFLNQGSHTNGAEHDDH